MITAPLKMQFSIWLFVFTLIINSAFPGDATEQEEDEKETNREESRNDENSCVCKDTHSEPGLKIQQLQDGNGKKCNCQKVKRIIKKKLSAAAARKKRQKPHDLQKAHYCLVPGRAKRGGTRRYYCIQTKFYLKKCKPCKPVIFIPTPL